MATIAPYGSWTSPITPELLVEKVVGLSYPLPDGEDLYWLEMRPSEGGRYVIVHRAGDGSLRDVIGEEFSARTLVHEYGGLCYAVAGGYVFFSNFADQRLHRTSSGANPVPLTPAPGQPLAHRFADPALSPDGRWIVCVRERHEPGDVVNEIVAMPADGSAEPQILAEGHDFYAAPRVSPAGDRLAWLSWDHPQMPWDGTELWEAEVGEGFILGDSRLIAGGREESISQPRYSPAGVLHYVSDRSGWWNLYAADRGGGRAVARKDAEFSGPDWVFGQCTYCFLADGSVIAKWSESGLDRLGVIPPGESELREIETPFTSIESVSPFGSGIVAVAGSAARAPAVVEIAVPLGAVSVLRPSRESSVPNAYLSAPRPIEFPTENGLTAHALYYPPANPDFIAPEGERPPLIVMGHGGPTSATSSTLNYGVQFWTSRGIGVVDVNYGGSTGYGRDYRNRLRSSWGVVDVDDCVNAASWLATQGEVDPDRLIIRGGSAGGYTTLCALTFRDVFACGSSLYGVADAGALAEETHKFEARYLDGLIGPWPQARALYEERSPIFHTDRLTTPLILFQGLEDKVVPPEQAEMMAEALRKKGIPFALVVYPDEQHGFRKAENIKRTCEAELYFYGRILGFEPAGNPQPVPIENLPA
jgi:dipeptidyl aminopeptidase/acylaminoacyl peptidase